MTTTRIADRWSFCESCFTQIPEGQTFYAIDDVYHCERCKALSERPRKRQESGSATSKKALR